MKKKIKQYKDENILYYKIKIRRIREVTGNKYNKEYKDKLWCVQCFDFSERGVGFCEKTLKELFNKLQKELWIK